ncbi:hypothetical protein JCM12856_21080 [Spirochaeta dissipatitropha]
MTGRAPASGGVGLCGAARPKGAPACELPAMAKRDSTTLQPAGCFALLLSLTQEKGKAQIISKISNRSGNN